MRIRIRSEQSFNPNEAQIQINVVLAKTLYSARVARSALQLEKTVEVLFDNDVAKIDRDRAHQAQFFFIPKGVCNVPDPGFKHIGATDFETRAASATVDRVEISGYGVAVFAERADYDVNSARPSSLDL